jgi:predicted MFS family arabinose efflux permease
LFGALLAGRFVHRQGNPMPFVLIITIMYCAVASFVFYGDDVYSAGFTYCCFCALLIFANVVVIHQLEKFATSVRNRDAGISDRAIGLACLLWTVGFNGNLLALCPYHITTIRIMSKQ